MAAKLHVPSRTDSDESKRFMWAGVSSSVIAAVIVLFCVLLFSYLLDWAAKFPYYSLISPLSVIYLVYPACWYFLIFRRINYSVTQTSILVSYIYPISCVFVGAICVVGAIFGYGVNRQAHFFDVSTSIISWTIMGFAIFLIPYALVAFPTAYLQRILLLWLFRPATR